MNQSEEYLKRILKVLIYIEAHVDEELTLKKLSKVACYSPYHFHRLFQAFVGETLCQYIKRLKLEKAAGKLRYTGRSVTQIALDASYDTSSAFTKAFRQFMGKSPKSYRLRSLSLLDGMIKKMEELPNISPNKIVGDLPDLNLFFVRRYGHYTKSSREAWETLRGFLEENHLDSSKMKCFGISHDDPQVTGEEKLRYDAAIFAPCRSFEKGEIGRQILKGGRYAQFTHKGAYDGLEALFGAIFFKWLPISREGFDEKRPIFCEYFHMEFVKRDLSKLITHIYIPLLKT